MKKTGGGVQVYNVITVLAESKYECQYEPNTAPQVKFVFKEADLVAV